MNEADEVAAYSSAAAQAYLDSIDNTLVERVIALGLEGGLLLDLGSGPGNIPLKLARRCARLRVIGVDRSPHMIRVARQAAGDQGLLGRVHFFLADAHQLCFPDACFDWVLSNSLLHHLRNPCAAFNEMARVVKPDGVVVVRDLRRPSRLLFPLHVWWYGRYYSGLMKKLYGDSVKAAYTGEELARMLGSSSLSDARIFFHARTHLGFIRHARSARQVQS